jgi:hypothetical protein
MYTYDLEICWPQWPRRLRRVWTFGNSYISAVGVDLLSKQLRRTDDGVRQDSALGVGLTIPHHIKLASYYMLRKGSGFDVFFGSRYGQVVHSCEHGNEILGSLQGEEFID